MPKDSPFLLSKSVKPDAAGAASYLNPGQRGMKSGIVASLSVACYMICCAQVSAQTSRFDIAASYQALYTESQTFSAGGNVAAIVNIGRSFSFFGEVGLARKDVAIDQATSKTVLYDVMFGPRMNTRLSRTVVFAQLGVGIVRSRITVVGDDLNVSGTTGRPAFQPGAGVAFSVSGAWSLISQVDYRHVKLRRTEDGRTSANDTRALVGLQRSF